MSDIQQCFGVITWSTSTIFHPCGSFGRVEVAGWLIFKFLFFINLWKSSENVTSRVNDQIIENSTVKLIFKIQTGNYFWQLIKFWIKTVVASLSIDCQSDPKTHIKNCIIHTTDFSFRVTMRCSFLHPSLLNSALISVNFITAHTRIHLNS